MNDRAYLEYLENQLRGHNDSRECFFIGLCAAILMALVLYTGEGPTGEMVLIASLPMLMFLGFTCCEDTSAEDERMRDIYVEAVHLRYRIGF